MAQGSTTQRVSDESVVLLRRMVKLMESNAFVDIQGRQKVHLEALLGNNAGTNIAAGVAGVPSVNGPTPLAPIQSPAMTWLSVWTGPIDQRFVMMDQARNTYANGIRSNLSFS